MAPWVFQLFFSQSFVDSGAFWFHPTRQALLAIPTRKRRKGRPRTRRRDSSPTCLVSSWCRASRNIRGCWKRWVFLILLRLLASRNNLCTFFAQKMWLQFHVVLVKRYTYEVAERHRTYPQLSKEVPPLQFVGGTQFVLLQGKHNKASPPFICVKYMHRVSQTVDKLTNFIPILVMFAFLC